MEAGGKRTALAGGEPSFGNLGENGEAVEGGGKRTIPGGAGSFGNLGESEDPAVSQNERRKQHTSMCSQARSHATKRTREPPCIRACARKHASTQARKHATKRASDPPRNRAASPPVQAQALPTPPLMYAAAKLSC